MSATEPFTVDSTNPETRSDTPETHDDTKPYTNSSCPHVIVNVINVIARATRSIARLGLLEIRIDLILLSLRLRLRIASRHRWNNDKKPATVPAALVNVATGLLVHNPRIPCERLPYYSKGATEFTADLIVASGFFCWRSKTRLRRDRYRPGEAIPR
ncbi:hypothetical protein SUGI_1475630 [Cryptomeria japonica]|uniref:Uncharacterized protein n=1 Tax=Cryptomeria japonica TaxID=3369 RepID=A0AAD3NRW3_CRYJA|nr:hypothetical protein SUGI_1467040 [Cryptomeria japonica]GLJ58774.1 hypothetical protein SUGI_1475630 [Cryptomeria japonica]